MRRATAILGVVALAAAACGYNPHAATTVTSTHAAPAPSVRLPAGTVVRIYQGAFLPGRVIVIVGHAVQWQNYDAAGRRVQATEGASFRSGVLRRGQVFSWTPRRLGKVRYRDPTRPDTVGTIVVVS